MSEWYRYFKKCSRIVGTRPSFRLPVDVTDRLKKIIAISVFNAFCWTVAEDTELCITIFAENSGHAACLREIHSTHPCGRTERERVSEGEGGRENPLHICTDFLRKLNPTVEGAAAIFTVEVRIIFMAEKRLGAG